MYSPVTLLAAFYVLAMRSVLAVMMMVKSLLATFEMLPVRYMFGLLGAFLSLALFDSLLTVMLSRAAIHSIDSLALVDWEPYIVVAVAESFRTLFIDRTIMNVAAILESIEFEAVVTLVVGSVAHLSIHKRLKRIGNTINCISDMVKYFRIGQTVDRFPGLASYQAGCAGDGKEIGYEKHEGNERE